ncbi:type IV secretion system protein [Bartonella sp. CB175]|uniref:type IV secretion system protein n=1 Tax=Bartonella sp. CB175 TaxID=3112256 RepID=UPI00300E5040
MRKYYLAILMALFFVSHATSQDATSPGESLDVDEYYKRALEGTKELEDIKSEAAETIYETTIENAKKIKEIENKLNSAKKPEEISAIQVSLSLLQAKLQADIVRLQSLSMLHAKHIQTKEEIREKEQQKMHKEIEKKFKEKLEQSKGKID